MNISPALKINLVLQQGDVTDQKNLEAFSNELKSLGKISDIHWLAKNDAPPASATVVVKDLTLLIPLSGIIDPAAETARLTKEITRIEMELVKLNARLENQGYLEKAPAAVIEKEKTRSVELTAQLEKFKAQLRECGYKK